MTHTTSVIAQQGQWPQQPEAARWLWREEVQAYGGGLRSPCSIPDSPWPEDETVCPPDLQRAACGEVPLQEAFQTLAYYQEEQTRAAVDLLEQETWAVTVHLAASGPIWSHIGRPTLRFALDCAAQSVPCHLELGTFAHLAALITPSAGERTLISARTPCWARVYPHHERQGAGQIGAVAYSYVPIPTAEAVATLGLGRILSEIEAATRAAGQAILARAQEQAARHERLLRVERMLGWGQEPIEAAQPCQRHPRIDQVFVLLARGGGHVAAGAAVLGMVMAVLCLLLGIPGALLPLALTGLALFIWYRGSAA